MNKTYNVARVDMLNNQCANIFNQIKKAAPISRAERKQSSNALSNVCHTNMFQVTISMQCQKEVHK